LSGHLRSGGAQGAAAVSPAEDALRTIDWRSPDTVVIVDQTCLPASLVLRELRTVDALVQAIRSLAVRGAPALGVAGALGVLVAAAQARREGWSDARLGAELERLRVARPTAANLSWGIDQVAARLRDGTAAAEQAATELLRREADACHAIGERGADLLSSLRSGPMVIQTHCNAGALACVEWGTALGVVRSLHRRGLLRHVTVDETRPLLQGARLTAWELARDGIPYEIVVDAAGPGLIAAGAVDAVVVGADRIAANGDVANKVGTYPLALAAARHDVPFVVAAPESTFDVRVRNGAEIPIEERAVEEVVTLGAVRTAPSGARARNPAFDVTPAELVTAIVTESRVLHPSTCPSRTGAAPEVPS